jgi:hypothetical protein
LAEEEGEFIAGGKTDFLEPKKQDQFFRAEKAGLKTRPKKLGPKKWG